MSLEIAPPTLRIHHVMVYVSDQDRSLGFYRDQLGFKVIADFRFDDGDRFVLVEPPDGATGLALVSPRQGTSEFALIGRSGAPVFVTDDIHAQYREWQARGVPFHRTPRQEV
jgi:catechol 2,3-dioxygenase-like lactoylglutathione lyase family enzyme